MKSLSMYLPNTFDLLNEHAESAGITLNGHRQHQQPDKMSFWNDDQSRKLPQFRGKCAPTENNQYIPRQVASEGLKLKSLMKNIRSRRSPRHVKSRVVVPDTLELLRQQIPDATSEQVEIIASVQELTMTSPERILALCNAVEYLSRYQIAGDFVECGVWRGGSMAAAAKTMINVNDLDRTIWMYDTFDGMSQPTERDVDFQGQTAERLLSEQNRDDARSVWCRSPLDQVKSTMEQTGYPIEQVEFVVGKVEETLPHTVPEKISLLRLDTDWYESTRCELESLFPRLVPGGVLIVDDYGHWDGCRRAVDEYFQQNQIAMLLNRIDYTGRIGIHCPGAVRNDD